MHPDLLLDHAIHRIDEAQTRALLRRRVHRRSRSPGRRLRQAMAAALVRLAARLAEEPVGTGLRRA